jgi:ABC-type multidrug transport system ATPase subunit
MDGVRWIRTFLREFADHGRTVFVSSHLMSEMEQTADRLVVIGRGKLLAGTDSRVMLTGGSVRVRGPDLGPLAAALAGYQIHWKSTADLLSPARASSGSVTSHTNRVFACTSSGQLRPPWSRPISN